MRVRERWCDWGLLTRQRFPDRPVPRLSGYGIPASEEYVITPLHALVDAIREYQRITWAIVDPNTCYLLIRGLKTLALRVERQNETAMVVARYLEGHPRIRRVNYPGLESHVDYEIAREQMRGFGGLISFEIDGDLKKTRDFVNGLALPYIAPSLGGVETLVSHPATISYYDLGQEERLAIGITDQLVRYSVGIEESSELIEDLERGLNKL